MRSRGRDSRDRGARTLKCGALLCVSRYSVPPINAASVTSSSSAGQTPPGRNSCASDATGATYSASFALIAVADDADHVRRAGSGEHDRRRQWFERNARCDAGSQDGAIALRVGCRAYGRIRCSADTCRISAHRPRAWAGGCTASDCRRSRPADRTARGRSPRRVSLPVATSSTWSTLSSEPPGEMPIGDVSVVREGAK